MTGVEYFALGFLAAVLLMFSWAGNCYKRGWDQATADWVETDNDEPDNVIEFGDKVYKAISVGGDAEEVLVLDMLEQERENI